MKNRLRRAFRAAAVVVLLLAIAVVVAGVVRVRRAWPRIEGAQQLDGLHGPVEVFRDPWGVPHIFAENDHDLLFVQGFVHAQDRLWSMDFDRRLAKGALSEMIGPQTLRLDRYLRTLGSRRASERDWRVLSEETRALIEAYCAGINAFIESHRGRYPVEYTIFRSQPAPWEPIDVLVRVKLMSWLLSQNQQFETLRALMIPRLGDEKVSELLPPYRDGAPLIVPPGVDGYGWLRDADLADELADFYGGTTTGWGSNQWSLSGERTASGKPLLANDTHLEMAMPSVWYHNGLHGGSFDVVGASLPGVPLVILGTNGRIAWGVTDMLPDVEDYFVERLDDPERPQRYEFAGEWRELEIFTESIAVRGAETVELEVLATHHGPIMNAVVGRLREHPEKLAICWTEHQPNRVFDALFALVRSSDWTSFRRALSLWSGPHMNFGYADAEGHVGYQATGLVPVRAEGHQGLVPVPGWTGEAEWQGYLPFASLPFLFDPPDGMVMTANQKVVGDDYPHHLAYEWSDPYRALRITQLLDGRNDLTADDLAAVQLDTYSLHAEALRPVLLAVEPEGPLQQRAYEQVSSWDLRNDPESAGAAIFQVWYRRFLEHTVGDELGETLTDEYRIYTWVHGPMMAALVGRPDDSWFDDVTTADTVETLALIAQRSFAAAVSWLAENHGDEPEAWAWGRLHPAIFGHRPFGRSGIAILERLFNGPSLPAPGDRYTVNAAWFAGDRSRPFAANGGAGQRLIVDLADPDASRFVQNSGQVEHLFHPHRHDLARAWSEGVYRPLLFTREAVEARAAARLRLKPAEPSGRP